MADVQKNLEVWESGWDWSNAGEEWSASWGGTHALWFGTLLPRIHPYLPTGIILEIAPGYGRWTQFLKGACERLVIVDLAERCIEHCRERFADADNIDYHVNDGRSLAMVEDGAIDFAFSFDSLVHAEADVLEAYLHQLARKLKPDGVGFIHHSNAGRYRRLGRLAVRLPETVRRPLVNRGALPDIYAWRAESVTAEWFADCCQRVGMACVAQENISWERGRFLTDALSLFTPRGSRWERPLAVTRNPHFRREAHRLARLWA
jgi:SAM-dependent methyltransferase